MKIAVLGAGSVGRAIAGRLAQLSHQVTVGTRDVAVTMALTAPIDVTTTGDHGKVYLDTAGGTVFLDVITN